ncbi:hypothetical protein [Acholeplasma laidlawii]|nr:hypothetical protein [Acholeplasma laidlawii]NWH09754.1 hypothetical protein [Acholeplasma laidlawii]NWH11145.1 hypothetical protein [Acholeplasma laidlawii]NWH14577.1 hypothetical protein [Acholeplasma laidlawii]
MSIGVTVYASFITAGVFALKKNQTDLVIVLSLCILIFSIYLITTLTYLFTKEHDNKSNEILKPKSGTYEIESNYKMKSVEKN